MDSMEKAKRLYQKYVQRFSDQNHPYQAAFYEKSFEVLSGAKNMEDAQAKLTQPRLVEEGQMAPVLDDLDIKRKSAEESCRKEVALLCEETIEQIKRNPGLIMEGSFYREIQAAEQRYDRCQDGLLTIFSSWLVLKSFPYSLELEEEYKGKIQEALKILATYGETTETLLKQPCYGNLLRDHRDISQEVKEAFFKEIPLIEKMNPGDFDSHFLDFIDQEEEETVWKEVRDLEEEIKAVGRNTRAFRKRGAAMAVAPKDNSGEYDFFHEYEEEE